MPLNVWFAIVLYLKYENLLTITNLDIVNFAI